MKKFALAGAAIAALIAIPALAQQGGGPRGPIAQARMAQPMTRAAVETRVQAQFARIDANRDGFVTQAQAQARIEARGQRRAGRGDRRGDRFARLDTNRDDSISRAEFDVAAGARADRRAHRAERRGDSAGRGSGMAQRGQRGMGGFGSRLFQLTDTNRDGRISLAEASAGALARFERLDTNRDGMVTPDERRAQRQQRRDG